MPLHDWNVEKGWEMVHHLWISELTHWLKTRLPAGYRAFIGSSPALTVEIPGTPDVGIRNGFPLANGETNNREREATDGLNGDNEFGKVITAQVKLAPDRYVYVETGGRLVAAIELISPANKDRPSKRTASINRYSAYIQNGIHLLLVDVLPKPRGFSFAEGIAAEVPIPDQPPCPAPMAVSYCVGQRSPGGESMLEIWERELTPGRILPVLPIWLNSRQSVPIDLEATYTKAAADAYFD